MNHKKYCYIFLPLFIGLLTVVSCSDSKPDQVIAVDNRVLSSSANENFRAADYNLYRNVYFGDLHLHTSYSFDAAAALVKTTPEDAYHYALGDSIQYMGKAIQRLRPLDFLAVTDHSEYLGVSVEAAKPDGPFSDTDWPTKIAELDAVMMGSSRLFSPSGFLGQEDAIAEFVKPELIKTNWQRQITAAEQFYQPGAFTTFVAYEWSPMPNRAHMHRNVIFKGPNYPDIPFSALDSLFPEDLWTYAENHRAQDIDSILIPHNSNLSHGLMFDYKDSHGNPLTAAYAARRASNEPLVEIFQNKGNSETTPLFSPEDEFADFEILPEFGPIPQEQQAGGFVRPALKRGLEIQSNVEANPFRLGFVGGTDFHSGASSSEENNFPGGLGTGDSQDDPIKTLTEVNPVTSMPVTVFSAGGMTAVWAEQNTREAIFAAMKRRETYATSGTRIRIRMFASSNFTSGTMENDNWLQDAYENGVPMGGDLFLNQQKAAPRFLLEAVKDPDGANIDRIQIIKIWIEAGEAKEKVFDALWNDNRQLDANGKLPPVGDTVDLSTATWTNTIGAAIVRGVWLDPEFNASQPSLYYARVLEIPTPRWPTYLAVRNSLPLTEHAPATFQERAWTSPIFYNP